MAILNLNRIALRGHFFYDWVRNSGKAAKGNAQTFDVQIHYAIDKHNNLGAWLGIKSKFLLSKGLEGTPTEKWKNENIQNVGLEDYSYNLPDINANIFYIRGGIYFNLVPNTK